MFCVEEHRWGYFTRVYIGALTTRRPQVRTRCMLVRGHCLLVREHYLLVRTHCMHTHIYTIIYYLEFLIDFSALHAPFKEIDMVNCTLE